MRLTGIIKSGIGDATGNTSTQKPFWKERGLPRVDDLKSGTINVDLSPFWYEVVAYDYFFGDIEWEPHKVEDFGFIQIEHIFYNRIYWKPGYLYFPHRSPHFKNKNPIEICAVAISAVRPGEAIQVVIKKGKLILCSR